MLHLVNLVGLDDRWRNAAATPPVQTDVGLRYYVGGETVESVHLASPDLEHGRSTELPFTPGQDGRGRYVEITVPHLAYWDVLYLRRSG